MIVQPVYQDGRWHLQNNRGEILFGLVIKLTWESASSATEWLEKRYTQAFLNNQIKWVDVGYTKTQGQPGKPSMRHQPTTAASYRPAHGGYPGEPMLKPAPTLGELLREALKRGPSEGAAEKRLNDQAPQVLYWPLVQWPNEQVSNMSTDTGRVRSPTYGSLNDHNDEPMTVSVLGFLVSQP